jgi:hypothetical protein
MAYERDHREGDAPEVLTKTEARQAVTGHNVRYVLTYGLGGAIVVLAIVYFFFIH